MASSAPPLHICSWKGNHWIALQLTGPCLAALRAPSWLLRKILRPGLVARGAGHILEIFLTPLRSCPTCLGLYRRTQRPADVEPLHLDIGSSMPIFPTVLSGLHPAPLPSVWKRKKQIWQVVPSVIFLPSGRQREPMLPNFFTGRAQHGREAVQQLHLPAVSDQARAQFLLAIFFLRAETRS